MQVLRYFNAAGYDPEGEVRGLEKNPNNLLPIVLETILGWRNKLEVYGTDYDTPDGSCIRDYIHVSDLAVAHVQALNFLVKKNDDLVVNLGTSKGISVLEVLETARKVSGHGSPSSSVSHRRGLVILLWFLHQQKKQDSCLIGILSSVIWKPY
jgi:UDP-glucose 4-epimerase